MAIDIYLEKSVDQNAAHYYEKAKHARKKIEGTITAIGKTKQKLSLLEQEKQSILSKLDQDHQKLQSHRKKEWYEKFHWFFSSEGFLCIGGKDATSNEIVVKLHMDKDDIVIHTEAPGSPFFVVKNGKNATDKTIAETAQAAASYSKAWKSGVTTVDVFYVKPDQVSKKAKSGEYMPKGAFMIYGEKNFMRPLLEAAIGVVDGRFVGGAVDAIKAQTAQYVLLVPGRLKTSDVAKKVKHLLHVDDVDEIMGFIPSGGGGGKKECLRTCGGGCTSGRIDDY